jgi:hypothetical protein
MIKSDHRKDYLKRSREGKMEPINIVLNPPCPKNSEVVKTYTFGVDLGLMFMGLILPPLFSKLSF